MLSRAIFVMGRLWHRARAELIQSHPQLGKGSEGQQLPLSMLLLCAETQPGLQDSVADTADCSLRFSLSLSLLLSLTLYLAL